MNTLKENTILGVFWSFFEQFLSKGLNALTTLVLAWFLVPEDYALVAMLTVFIALSSSLVGGGFSQAIIRKPKISQTELSTVFWVNIILSIFIYNIIYIISPYVSIFYQKPVLENLLKVVSLALLSQSLSIVPLALLNRELKFKNNFIIALPAAIASSLLAIFLAYKGYGVWSLIFQILLNSLLFSTALLFLSKWKPSATFKIGSLTEVWRFSKFIIIESLLSIPLNNIYLMVLPKYFAVGPVGLYFFSQKIKDITVGLIVDAIQRVTYPALSKIQDDPERLLQGYRKVTAISTFLIFPAVCSISAFSPVIFEYLLPDKWLGAANYFQLMALASLTYPLAAININIMKIRGRSDLVLYTSLLKGAVSILVLLITLQLGSIEYVIMGQFLVNVIGFFINSFYSYRLIQYSWVDQFKDFVPALMASILIFFIILSAQGLTELPVILEVFLISVAVFVVYIYISFMLSFPAYFFFKEMIFFKKY